MSPLDNSLYVSQPNFKSFWNEYRIYPDRLELEFWLFRHTFVIPFEELITIALFQPPVFRTALWALKLDLADLNEHVGIERQHGMMKKLRFTPNDPHQFIGIVKQQANL